VRDAKIAKNSRTHHRPKRPNICDAFNDRYDPLLLIAFSCSAIDLTAGNSVRRDVAAPSLETIKAGRLQFF
jgi:hypothetical protein